MWSLTKLCTFSLVVHPFNMLQHMAVHACVAVSSHSAIICHESSCRSGIAMWCDTGMPTWMTSWRAWCVQCAQWSKSAPDTIVTCMLMHDAAVLQLGTASSACWHHMLLTEASTEGGQRAQGKQCRHDAVRLPLQTWNPSRHDMIRIWTRWEFAGGFACPLP